MKMIITTINTALKEVKKELVKSGIIEGKQLIYLGNLYLRNI